ncbi:MAG: transcription-repair coupling factor [Chloroflexi bacterium]|nr:transcription-repair coupling factor [Chloroflexota bacterium]
MRDILPNIQSLPGFHELLLRLENDEPLPNLGLARAARLPVLASLSIELQRPILLLTHRTDWALTLFDELTLWLGEKNLLYFPEPSSLFYENVAWGENNRRNRLLTLNHLSAVQDPTVSNIKSPHIIIAPARAVMARTIPPGEFKNTSILLESGETIEPGALARILVEKGYESTSTVTMPGQFTRRGGIMDIWPPAYDLPTRLDYFGDEIDSLRYFDPASQRTTRTHQGLQVTPAREFLIRDADAHNLSGTELTEFHIPLLHPEPAGLLSYLPEDALVLLDDWETIRDTIDELEAQAVTLRKDNIKEGYINNEFPIPYLTLGEIEDRLSRLRTLELGSVGDPQASQLAGGFSPGQRFGGQLKPLIDHLNKVDESGDDLIVVSRQAARLQELWDESQFEDTGDKPPRFIQGSLGEGWILTPPQGIRLHLITDGEIFGWKRPQPRQRPRITVEAPEAEYIDFQLNELVVHIDYGIGRFKGLVKRAVEGIEHEYLCVEYAEGDQLYVPVHQAERLTRYVGTKGYNPSLSRLGGVEWRNVKSRVKAAVEEVAEDLLELYAKRRVAHGLAFSPDTHWQKELEASFPYIETEDQLRVIAEVKQDMELPRPMDRLVCGDVGYGKTEVALRAAFKAVMDGKQVGILVPTTILAQQHFYTFRERLAAFPVEVEMLSRFRTPRQQHEIIFGLGQGSIDIIIGTHRLVQPDVQFKDLGLVIIDEEQRFGVTHKEHLKKLRAEVDVLTMTATPIPRTLYMALTGVRDISTINTPPEERLPIVTHVGEYSPRLVRQAVLRELERGGQVFFVHNRVQTIMAMRNQLARLVPEAHIGVAHGQMAEKDLSKRMQEFTGNEIDVLMCTSIIESGLDIPNANTLIVDRADTFGLAQLYQLRGRVGRGAMRAYAYFFRHRRKTPTEDARLRLETIAENSQLGAGYSIAMRDLEIRGSGDILGTRQHGQIAAVGFHLYTRLLNQAVFQLKKTGGLPPDSALATVATYHPLVNVDLPLVVNIPTHYVPDKSMRLRLYRRLAEMHSTEEIDALADEFSDRFGPPPESVKNLIYQLKIKVLAGRVGLEVIAVENGRLSLRFPQLPENAPPRRLPNLGRDVPTSKNTIWLPMDGNSAWMEKLLEVLDILEEKSKANELELS